MVAPASPIPNSRREGVARPRYGVELFGRLYPRRLRRQPDTSLGAVERERNARIAARLREGLPWFGGQAEDFGCVEDMVRSYAGSLQVLSNRHQEVADLLWAVSACSLKIDVKETGGAVVDRDGVQQKFRSRRYEQAAHPEFKPDQTLKAPLLKRPLEQVYAELTKSLERSCHRVVQDAFDSLDRLVDRSVVGLIEWTAPTLCLFHYFSELSDYRASRTVDHETDWDDDWEDGQRGVTTTTVRHEEVESRVRRRHEHHLMEAKAVALPAKEVVVPADVQSVIDSIPTWLRPESNIVTGTQFRGDVVEQRHKDHVWLKEKVVERQIETYDDPAVTLDRFVLTGWGEEEILVENQRRQEVVNEDARTAFLSEHRWTRGVAQWTAGLGGAAYLLSYLGSVAFLVLAVLLIAVATWHTARNLQNAVKYYRPSSPWQVYLFGLGGRALQWLTFLTLLAAAASWSFVLGIVGFGFGALTAAAISRVDRALGAPLLSSDA